MTWYENAALANSGANYVTITDSQTINKSSCFRNTSSVLNYTEPHKYRFSWSQEAGQSRGIYTGTTYTLTYPNTNVAQMCMTTG